MVEAAEHIYPWHGALFMRDWRRQEKCCHDLDLYNGLIRAWPERVASFGGRKTFIPENGPRIYGVNDMDMFYKNRRAGRGLPDTLGGLAFVHLYDAHHVRTERGPLDRWRKPGLNLSPGGLPIGLYAFFGKQDVVWNELMAAAFAGIALALIIIFSCKDTLAAGGPPGR